MITNFNELKLKLDTLAIFQNARDDMAVQLMADLIDSLADGGSPEETVSLYSGIVEFLYPVSSDWSAYINKLVIEDENFYIKAVAAGKEVDSNITAAVDHELAVLQTLADIKSSDLKEAMGYDGFLPSWTNQPVDIVAQFNNKLDNITKTGYGIYAKYDFFRLEDGVIVPVKHPDYQTIDQLFGYERERNLIMKNTEALVMGTGANNMLLYGDAGTGKSSTIKAVAAHFAPQGLRIIEVKKNQLYQIPGIMEELAMNPLKFIIFIDDLSFTGNDDNFSALKATLEGSISGTSSNVAIFATSNRRHLVKENFADRMGDELYTNDTLQETMSLAARFGLAITFQKPGKDEYLSIVRSLADEYGIVMEDEELFKKAEAHAIRKNGRSPRTAKQFIELLKIGIKQ